MWPQIVGLLMLFVVANSARGEFDQLPALDEDQPSTSPVPMPSPVLNCFYCRHSNRERDVIDRLDQHPECLSYELFVNQSQFRRICTPMEPYCTTSVSSLNGFFADMRRDCTERCRPGCMESGYGIAVRICTRCCQSTFCNHFDGRKFLLNELDVQQLGGKGPNGTVAPVVMEEMPFLISDSKKVKCGQFIVTISFFALFFYLANYMLLHFFIK